MLVHKLSLSQIKRYTHELKNGIQYAADMRYPVKDAILISSTNGNKQDRVECVWFLLLRTNVKNLAQCFHKELSMIVLFGLDH